MKPQQLGKQGLVVSAMRLGCMWAISLQASDLRSPCKWHSQN